MRIVLHRYNVRVRKVQINDGYLRLNICTGYHIIGYLSEEMTKRTVSKVGLEQCG